MNILDAAYKVMSAEWRPMSAEEVTRRIADGVMWKLETKTPVALVGAALKH